MKVKKVTAVIERASDGGYGVYCPDIKDHALYGYGLTENEAKQNLLENLDEFLFDYKERSEPVPDELAGGHIEFNYVYDFSGFFQAYPMFNISELAAFVDINASLMRNYKIGKKHASPEQKKKIEAGIHALAEKLSAVSF